jgi:hypothetical protein
MAGEVLNRDVQDIHPGYIHASTVLAFRLFGTDMLSLRYPLMLVSFLQACNVFVLLQRRDRAVAASGQRGRRRARRAAVRRSEPELVLHRAGDAPGVVADPGARREIGGGCPARCHRGSTDVVPAPHTGAWVVMAVLMLALLERSPRDGRPAKRVAAARVLLLTMLRRGDRLPRAQPETEPGGLVLMAAWPIVILLWMLIHVRTSNADTVAILASVALGGAVAARTARRVPRRARVRGDLACTMWCWRRRGSSACRSTARLVRRAANRGPVSGAHLVNPVQIANGLYWTALPLLSAVNGWLILARLRARQNAGELILPVIASFHALTALLLEGPLYLYYSAGLTLLSLLWFASAGSRPTRWAGPWAPAR